MRKIVTGFVFSTFLLMGVTAFADNSNDYGVTPGPNDSFTTDSTVPTTDNSQLNRGTTVPSQQPGTVINNNNAAGTASDDTAMSSSANRTEMTRGYLSDNIVSFQPQAGVMVFHDAFANSTSRGVVGLTADMNAVPLINREAGHLFVGPATGLLYSHVGSPSANFFGSNSDVGLSDSANFLMIPADLKVGIAIGDNVRLSARGGGNVTYRSVASSLNLGTSSTTSDSSWKIFPNAGADLEFGFGRNVSLMLRPDVTFTPGDNVYTGTVGLGINLG